MMSCLGHIFKSQDIAFAVVIRLESAMYCSRPMTSTYLRRLDDIT